MSEINLNASSVLPKYYEKTLTNKLKIVAIPYKNKSNVISVDIFYKVGSKDEIMGKSGIAHMLEHLNFKSSKNLKAGEFDEIVTGFGGVNNAGTSFDYTHYYIKASKKNLDKSLELFSELMSNLNLKDDEFQIERDVVAQEQLLRSENDPQGFLYFKLFNNLFEYSSYHWTPIGFKQDIKNWNIKDIKKFHKKYYTPNNAILIVSGDISKDEVFTKGKKYFANIKNTNSKIPKPNHMKEPIFSGEKNIKYYKDVSVDTIIMAFKMSNLSTKEQVSLDFISEILTSGKNSILYKSLKQNKQLASSFYSYNMDLVNNNIFILAADGNSKVDASDIKKEFKKAIKILKTKLVDKKEINKIILNTKKDFIVSLQSASSLSSIYGSYFIKDDIKSLVEYEKNTKDITPQDILDVSNKYLKYPTTLILTKEDTK